MRMASYWQRKWANVSGRYLQFSVHLQYLNRAVVSFVCQKKSLSTASRASSPGRSLPTIPLFPPLAYPTQTCLQRIGQERKVIATLPWREVHSCFCWLRLVFSFLRG